MNIEILKKYQEKIINLAQKYHSNNIRVFGSVARGEATENSDIDFLIDPTPEQDLFDVIHLKRSLTNLLQCEVDLVHSTALHHTIKNQVLRESILVSQLGET